MRKNYAFWVTLESQSNLYHRGEAEVHILNFKTTWSVFQKESQTATEQGEAELPIFNFEITWLEFQKHIQTTKREAKLS